MQFCRSLLTSSPRARHPASYLLCKATATSQEEESSCKNLPCRPMQTLTTGGSHARKMDGFNVVDCSKRRFTVKDKKTLPRLCFNVAVDTR
ncbi:hypothetical protein GUJ93_ZPchr0009g820 [Zizania palustris]|uniref:Uncharacterized protein n=1 Tax=Zizania palustris TaxID=103762 RepID=A0A8J5RQH8_ZIZPA|nr:hypothetical protein GUJ93_ZPchr0009g820 [Zizania palustris]